MSTFHEAVFARSDLSRQELFDRYEPVFRKHKVPFLHSVRGLNWDASLGRFLANMDQELEELPDFRAAVEATQAWECACFDIRFLRWEFELYLFQGRPPHTETESVAMSFPDSLYKTATQDAAIAARWLAFLKDVGIALGKPAMACGIQVLIASSTEASLLTRFRHAVDTYVPGSKLVHTLLCRPTALDEALRSKAAADMIS
jgi:hypothetical protein